VLKKQSQKRTSKRKNMDLSGEDSERKKKGKGKTGLPREQRYEVKKARWKWFGGRGKNRTLGKEQFKGEKCQLCKAC